MWHHMLIPQRDIESTTMVNADQIRPDCPGLPEQIHPHMFRRTRATGLYRSGVELEMISVILGHSSTQTTRIYATPSVEMIREAMSAATADCPEETAEWEADENELARLCGLRLILSSSF